MIQQAILQDAPALTFIIKIMKPSLNSAISKHIFVSPESKTHCRTAKIELENISHT
jgi:hypothetical protein